MPGNRRLGKPPEVEGRDRGPSLGAWPCPGCVCAARPRASSPGSRRSRVGTSSVLPLSHLSSRLLAGVELAGAQGKHLGLISGEYRAWRSQRPALLPEKAEPRLGGGAAQPPSARGPPVPGPERRAAYPTSELNGKCLRTVRKLFLRPARVPGRGLGGAGLWNLALSFGN